MAHLRDHLGGHPRVRAGEQQRVGVDHRERRVQLVREHEAEVGPQFGELLFGGILDDGLLLEPGFDGAGVKYDLRQQAGSGTWQLFSFDPTGAKVELDFEASETL